MRAKLHSPKAGAFAVLADPARFAEVFLDEGAVAWPGELDLAPDAMHREILAKVTWHPA